MLVKSDEFKFISVMFPVRTTFIFEPAKHVWKSFKLDAVKFWNLLALHTITKQFSTKVSSVSVNVLLASMMFEL
jgi:hypothetical protein